MGRSYTYIPLHREIEITHIISLFQKEFTRNYNFGGEIHDFWELVYVDKGQILITAGENCYPLKAGELAFHKPGEFHALRSHGNMSANAIIASFVCKNPCMKYFEHRFTSLNTQEREYLYEALRVRDEIFSFNSLPKSINEQIIQCNLEMLLIKLLQRSSSSAIQSRIDSYAQLTHARQIAKKINEYLEINLSKKLTLDQIASEFGYSVSYITKLYRRQTGKSIIDTLIDYRMKEARRQIQVGNMNISQIADGLGYDNVAYFSRLFRQRFNMTPTACARLYKESNPL